MTLCSTHSAIAVTKVVQAEVRSGQVEAPAGESAAAGKMNGPVALSQQ
jgi:hypothetical protein